MCQEVCAVKYVPKSTNTELLQNQSDLDPDIITAPLNCEDFGSVQAFSIEVKVYIFGPVSLLLFSLTEIVVGIAIESVTIVVVVNLGDMCHYFGVAVWTCSFGKFVTVRAISAFFVDFC